MTSELALNLDNIPWIFSGIGIVIMSVAFKAIKTIGGFITNSMCLGVAGDYNVFIDNSKHTGPHGQANLKQFFGWVLGSITINVTESGNQSKRLKYKYAGSYSREQAVLKFRELGKDKRIIGGTVLKVLGRGDKILGCNTFWHHTHEQGGIRSQSFQLKRTNA